MEKYWKLIDIQNGTYSTHETEEEVNHIIEYNTRHLSDDKVTKRINIETPFSNYDFQFVHVFDKYHTHQFLYFFDTIEEERDDFEERIMILQTHRDVDIDEKQREFEDAYEAMESQLKGEINSQAYLIRILRRKLSECESALEHAECFMTGHKDEAETLKEENERLSRLYNETKTELFNTRRACDFWHKKFFEIADDDYPF